MAGDGRKARRITGVGRERGRAAGAGLLAAIGLGAIVMVGGCAKKDPNAKISDEEGAALLQSVRKHPPKPDDLTPGEKIWLRDYMAGQKAK